MNFHHIGIVNVTVWVCVHAWICECVSVPCTWCGKRAVATTSSTMHRTNTHTFCSNQAAYERVNGAAAAITSHPFSILSNPSNSIFAENADDTLAQSTDSGSPAEYSVHCSRASNNIWRADVPCFHRFMCSIHMVPHAHRQANCDAREQTNRTMHNAREPAWLFIPLTRIRASPNVPSVFVDRVRKVIIMEQQQEQRQCDSESIGT